MSRPLVPMCPPYLNAVPNPANVVTLTAAPTSAYVDQPVGTIGLYNGAAYLLTAKTSSAATWLLLESSGGAGVFTTLSSTGATTLNTTGAATTTIGTGGTGAVAIGNATGNTAVTGGETVTVPSGSTIGLAVDTSAGTGVAGTFKSTAAATDALQLITGGLKVNVATGSGTNTAAIVGRFGQADFTADLNAAATAAYTVTTVGAFLGTTNVVLATVSCSSAGSAVVIRDIATSTAASGTITFTLTNLGGSNATADIFVNYWVLN